MCHFSSAIATIPVTCEDLCYILPMLYLSIETFYNETMNVENAQYKALF